MHSLRRLTKVLEKYENFIYKLKTRDSNIPKILCKLINVLLNCCVDADEKTRIMIAECLGELGAIDPTRIVSQELSSDKSFHLSVINSDFIIDLLMELSKCFLRASTRDIQDNVAFAIQVPYLYYVYITAGDLVDRYCLSKRKS